MMCNFNAVAHLMNVLADAERVSELFVDAVAAGRVSSWFSAAVVDPATMVVVAVAVTFDGDAVVAHERLRS